MYIIHKFLRLFIQNNSRNKILCSKFAYLGFLFKKKHFIYLFLERREGREKERERNINVWLCPPLGTWPAAQACALTGNRTGDPLVRRPMLNPLSYTSQGKFAYLNFDMNFQISSPSISIRICQNFHFHILFSNTV